MTYEEAIAFWFGRINYEQRIPRITDLKLDRMRTLLDLLGNPQDQLRIVHVAGSKGKGSTSAMLESILRHAGYRTGLYTSPHLERIEERLMIDGQICPTDRFLALAAEVQPAARTAYRRPQHSRAEVPGPAAQPRCHVGHECVRACSMTSLATSSGASSGSQCERPSRTS